MISNTGNNIVFHHFKIREITVFLPLLHTPLLLQIVFSELTSGRCALTAPPPDDAAQPALVESPGRVVGPLFIIIVVVVIVIVVVVVIVIVVVAIAVVVVIVVVVGLFGQPEVAVAVAVVSGEGLPIA